MNYERTCANLFEVGERGEWNEDGIGVRVKIIGSSEKSERE
jgi:hypothetical protein